MVKQQAAYYFLVAALCCNRQTLTAKMPCKDYLTRLTGNNTGNKSTNMSNLTQVVNTDKNMKTLKKGVHASDLDQLLSSTGPYTFFAPNDMAFEKLEKGMMEQLLEPQNRAQLANLMNNHIVSGRIIFSDLKDGDKLTTVNGKELTVTVKNGSVLIGQSTVTARDSKISNGVMHVTDTVLQ
jgi:uncharacterized surface protein with fasciclin (FAS1) repeats